MLPTPQPESSEQHGPSKEVQAGVVPVSSLEALKRLFQAAQVVQQIRAAGVCLGMRWFELQGLVEARQRRRRAAKLTSDHT